MGRPEKTSWFGALNGGGLRKSVLQSVFTTLITWFAGPTPAAAQNAGGRPFGPPIVHVIDAPFGETSAAMNGCYACFLGKVERVKSFTE
jgi:hypothetical protein